MTEQTPIPGTEQDMSEAQATAVIRLHKVEKRQDERSTWYRKEKTDRTKELRKTAAAPLPSSKDDLQKQAQRQNALILEIKKLEEDKRTEFATLRQLRESAWNRCVSLAKGQADIPGTDEVEPLPWDDDAPAAEE